MATLIVVVLTCRRWPFVNTFREVVFGAKTIISLFAKCNGFECDSCLMQLVVVSHGGECLVRCLCLLWVGTGQWSCLPILISVVAFNSSLWCCLDGWSCVATLSSVRQQRFEMRQGCGVRDFRRRLCLAPYQGHHWWHLPWFRGRGVC